jgi:hypothetical protein
MFHEFKKNAKIFLVHTMDTSSILQLKCLFKIAKGGYHCVYLSSYSSDFVIKITHRVIELIQNRTYQFTTKAINRYIIHENSKYYRLYNYFGYNRCILQSTERASIQIHRNGEILTRLGAVVVQQYEKALRGEPKVELITRYLDLEWSTDLDVENYELSNCCLLSDSKFSEVAYLSLNSRIYNCFYLIERDGILRKELLFFINAFRSYMADTKTIIDLVGENNVILVNHHSQWNIRVGSIVKDTSWQAFEEALIYLNDQPKCIVESIYLKNALLNGLAVCRLINALSLKLQGCRVIPIMLTVNQLNNLSHLKYFFENIKSAKS